MVKLRFDVFDLQSSERRFGFIFRSVSNSFLDFGSVLEPGNKDVVIKSTRRQ